MEIPVWQFVRIMVACEKRPTSRLLAANADSWSELDEALTGLAQSDFDAYSHLMMHTNVHIEAPNPIELRRVLDSLLRDLKLAKRRTRAGSTERTDLEFEISELQGLLEKLGGRVSDEERDSSSKRAGAGRPVGRGQRNSAPNKGR
ncbi:MAG: hypothetical protein CMF26_00365 [Kiloniella sp.]|nr:hypothetical protein [Kiloniella sp.]